MIDLTNLVVTFGRGTPNETRALRGLTLRIEDGDFVTVIGSNGAGKSTLLNAIAGEIPLGGGAIRIGTDDVSRESPAMRARRVARVFQDPMAGTCGALSLEANMAVAAGRTRPRSLRRGLAPAERELFRERLALLGLGLENRLGDSIGLLSGGQRQAVSLLMATLAPSRILLLDDHTAALDPKASELVLGLTNRMVGEGRLTALMITHSMRDALAYGNRIVMLHEGRVVFDACGAEKESLSVQDLLELFVRAKGEALDSDRMLLS